MNDKFTGDYFGIITFLNAQEDKSKQWDITPHKEKRSLDANGMLWSCLQEMATSLHTDKWSVYLMMLKRYGKFSYVIVHPNAVEAMKKQWRELEVVGEVDVNGKKGIQLLCYYGSSTYNTKEFAVLLDGVISEMKEMGLTPPPTKDMQLIIENMRKRESEKQTDKSV